MTSPKIMGLAKTIRNSGLAEYPLRFAEWLLFGGRTAEALLLVLLRWHYKSRIRRVWWWRREPPHFFNHRWSAFDLLFGDSKTGPYVFYRGFFSSELIRPQDTLLDIGCGDGFFSRRFFSTRCSRVDGVDIEADAIDTARQCNAGNRVRYHLSDAARQPFPDEHYDVIVWDGAIGHFPPETTELMLRKITSSLKQDGVFTGSESLGFDEGHDHLQFFGSVEDIDRLFRKHFSFRAYRVVEYDIGQRQTFMRREAYWRCANHPERIAQSGWQILT